MTTVTDSEAVIRRRIPLIRYFPETAEVDLLLYPTVAPIRPSSRSTVVPGCATVAFPS
jgi:hypothetical protein